MHKIKAGDKFGHWIVICYDGQRVYGCKTKVKFNYWLCKCDCGKEKSVKETHLVYGNSKSCGCGLSNIKEIIKGKKFMRLTIIKRGKRIKNKGQFWICKCICGKTVEVKYNHLISGTTKSCGCLKNDLNVKRMNEATRKYPIGTNIKQMYRDNLFNSYVAWHIVRGTMLSIKEIPLELIKLKREQLKLYRLIKQEGM